MFAKHIRTAGPWCIGLSVVVAAGCQSLSRRGPTSSEVISCRRQVQRGLEAVERGDRDGAQLAFQGAVDTCPEDERARQQYAESLWNQGGGEDAILQMEEAVRLSGDSPALLVRLGQMYLAMGDLDSAWQRAEWANAVKPMLASAWALRGDIEQRRGALNNALASYHRALSYQPNYPPVQLAVARIYHQLNRPQRALVTLQTLADQTVPGNEPAELAYLEGLAFKSLGRYEDAIRSLIAANQQGPQTPELLYQLGEAKLLAGDPDAAQRAAHAALSLQSWHQPSRQLLVRIQQQRQRTATAVRP